MHTVTVNRCGVLTKESFSTEERALRHILAAKSSVYTWSICHERTEGGEFVAEVSYWERKQQ
jgi:hypothetical protein